MLTIQQRGKYFIVGSFLFIFTILIILILIKAFFSLSTKESRYISPITFKFKSAKVITPTPWPKLTLEHIFNQSREILPKRAVSLVITGDVIPARSVNRIMRQLDDFLFPFAYTAEYLRSADITLINLEAPLIEDCPTTDQGMIFCGDPHFVEGLSFAGVDIANLANNHTTNYGKKGLVQTKELLWDRGIAPIGLGNIFYFTSKGIKFAFLGFNGVAPFDKNVADIDEKILVSQIKEASSEADIIVVSFHWGREYSRYPQPMAGIAPFDPRRIAYLAIQAGADVIVGNHPHWYQGIELYRGKIIFYALGNFIFDQFWSEETKKGFIAKLYFFHNQLIDVDIRPIYIEGIQPVFLEDNSQEEFMLELREASKILNSAPNVLGY